MKRYTILEARLKHPTFGFIYLFAIICNCWFTVKQTYLKKMSRADPTGVYCAEHPQAPLVEDYRAGDQICSECGLVVGDRLVVQYDVTRTTT